MKLCLTLLVLLPLVYGFAVDDFESTVEEKRFIFGKLQLDGHRLKTLETKVCAFMENDNVKRGCSIACPLAAAEVPLIGGALKALCPKCCESLHCKAT